MNKVVAASLLAVSAISAVSMSHRALAQDAAPAAPAAAGQVAMPDAEFAVYDNAVTKLAGNPQAQAPAIEAYLTQFPNSSVKVSVLEVLMLDYVQFDPAKALDAADRLLKVFPTSPRALLFEVYLRRQTADAQTDPAAKQAGLDAAAAYANQGLTAGKPKDFSDADFKKVEDTAVPLFYSVIGEDDLLKKDYAGAIAAYKSEIGVVPEAATETPGQTLQDIWFLGQAYYLSTPPDLINCTFYTTRAAAYAPQYAAQLQPLATYCYKKYHGGTDGYDAVTAAAKANLAPPADFKITPAPTDADQANQLMATTADADIPKLATGDKEYVLQYGSDANKAKVWDAVKGKDVEIPGALVIESSPTVVKVAVSDGAVQDKKADFTFNLKPLVEPEEPKAKTPVALAAYKKAKAAYEKQVADIAKATAVGQTVTLSGTYSSYTPSPIMIIMDGGEVVFPKATAKPPVRRR